MLYIPHFPCSASQLIYIFLKLKFQCVHCILNVSATNKSLISESMSVEISLTYKENNKGPRTVSCGSPDKTGTNPILIRLQFAVVYSTEKNLSFQCLPTYAIAKQFALKELVQWGIKCFLKFLYQYIKLSSIVQDLSPIIYYSSQLIFTTVSFSECMLSV